MMRAVSFYACTISYLIICYGITKCLLTFSDCLFLCWCLVVIQMIGGSVVKSLRFLIRNGLLSMHDYVLFPFFFCIFSIWFQLCMRFVVVKCIWIWQCISDSNCLGCNSNSLLFLRTNHFAINIQNNIYNCPNRRTGLADWRVRIM